MAFLKSVLGINSAKKRKKLLDGNIDIITFITVPLTSTYVYKAKGSVCYGYFPIKILNVLIHLTLFILF